MKKQKGTSSTHVLLGATVLLLIGAAIAVNYGFKSGKLAYDASKASTPNFVVSISATSPLSGFLLQGSQNDEVARFRFSNGQNNPVVVKSLRLVNSFGTCGATAFKLYQSTTFIAEASDYDRATCTVKFTNLSISVPAQSSSDVDVSMNVRGIAPLGVKFAMQVADVSTNPVSVVGGLPATANTFTVAGSIVKASQGGFSGSTTVTHGASQPVLLGMFKLEDSSTDVKLSGFVFTSSASPCYFEDFLLKDMVTNSTIDNSTMDSATCTVKFQRSGFVIAANSSKTVGLFAKVKNTAVIGQSFIFKLTNIYSNDSGFQVTGLPVIGQSLTVN